MALKFQNLEVVACVLVLVVVVYCSSQFFATSFVSRLEERLNQGTEREEERESSGKILQVVGQRDVHCSPRLEVHKTR